MEAGPPGGPLLFWSCGRAVCDPGRVRPGDFGGWCSQLPCLTFSILGGWCGGGPAGLLVVSLGGRLVVLPLPVGGWTGGGGWRLDSGTAEVATLSPGRGALTNE